MHGLVPRVVGSLLPFESWQRLPTPQFHVLEKPNIFYKCFEHPAAPACDSTFASYPQVPRKQQAEDRCICSCCPVLHDLCWLCHVFWPGSAHTIFSQIVLFMALHLHRNFRSGLPWSIGFCWDFVELLDSFREELVYAWSESSYQQLCFRKVRLNRNPCM